MFCFNSNEIFKYFNRHISRFTKTVNRFIVYKEGTQNIEIPHGIGQRSKYIDLLVNYFSSEEEYEKCSVLQELKDLVIMAGD